MSDLMAQIDAYLSATMPEEMGLPDWTYKDWPRCTIPAYEAAVALIGEENIKWLIGTRIPASGGAPETMRGQCLISPEGMRRLMADAATRAP